MPIQRCLWTQRIGCVVACLCTARTVGRGYNEQFKDAFRTQLAHMFERGFTQRTFRNGINKYINRHVSKLQRQDIKRLIHETLNSTLSSLRGQPYSSGKGKSDHLSKRIQPKKIEKTPKGKPAAAEPSAGAPLGEKQYAGKARDGWKKFNPRKVTAAETGTKVPEGLTKFGVARRKDDRTCYVSTLVTLLQCSALRNNGIFKRLKAIEESNPLVKGLLATAVNTDKADNLPLTLCLMHYGKRRTVRGDPIESSFRTWRPKSS